MKKYDTVFQFATSKRTLKIWEEIKMVTSLAKRNTAIIRLKESLADGSTKLALRCQRVGITTSNIDEVVAIASVYKTNVYSIVSMMEDGMTLKRAEQCLEIRQAMPNFTMRLINRYLEAFNFQVTPMEEVLDLFEEVANRIGGKYPLHRVFHTVEEIFDGDFHKAYSMAIEDIDSFVCDIKTKGRRLPDVWND